VNISEGVTQEAQAPIYTKLQLQPVRSQHAQVPSRMVLRLHRHLHMVFVLGILRFLCVAKAIVEINVVNYVGAIAAMAFIWVGTKIWKRNRVEVQKNAAKTAPTVATRTST